MAPTIKAIKPKATKMTAKTKSKTKAAKKCGNRKSGTSGEGAMQHLDKMSDAHEFSMFKTFTTDEALSGGLCLLRKLGDKQYEIVSLDSMTRDAVSSERMTLELKSVPERGTLLHQANGQFEAAKENCHLAMRVACK
jgi:hypothetical protein